MYHARAAASGAAPFHGRCCLLLREQCGAACSRPRRLGDRI